MRKLSAALLLLLACLALGGCGGGEAGDNTTGNSNAKSAGCITDACHGSINKKIVDEWSKSIHSTMNVAGCADCHTLPVNHACSSCHGGSTSVKSAAHTTECYICHDDFSSSDKGKLALDWQHLSATKFQLMTSGVVASKLDSAGYAVLRGTRYESKCKWCHNPHKNDLTEQHREWAESGHGEPKVPPFRYYDFKTRGTDNVIPANSTATDCVRCHTTTGYINYVSSNFTDISPWGAYRKSDGNIKIDPVAKAAVPIGNQKQVIYCNACHDAGNNPVDSGAAYGYSRRKVPKITAYYNYSVNVSGTKIRLNATKEATYPGIVARFDDLNTSNMCMACHVGRESGDTLQALGSELANISATAADTLFKNVGFINSHYLTAGATIFRKSGYEFPGRNYGDDVGYKHKSIGSGNSFGTGNDGPCVHCHLQSGPPSTSRHSFLPVKREPVSGASELPLDQPITEILSPKCANCHYADSGTTFDGTAASIQGIKTRYRSALQVLEAALLRYRNFYFATANPYIFATPYDPAYVEASAAVHCSKNVAVKNWLTGAGAYTWNATKKSCTPPVDGTAGTGEANMGAAFNFNLLFHDYGAFAHNSRYVKRLLYDSFDDIDGGGLDYSVRQILNDWYNDDGDPLNPLRNPLNLRPAGLSQTQVKDAMDYLLVGGSQNGTGGASPADRY